MQPQSDINDKKQTTANQRPQPPTTTTATAKASTPTVPTPATLSQKNHKHHRFPKIIKGKKPLIHFKFYLDICDHQLTKTIEEKITALGGCLEFFLTQGITHFITDKEVCINNNKIGSVSRSDTSHTPVGTPATPRSFDQSPYDIARNGGSGTPSYASNTAAAKKQTRADAMLSRARRGNTAHITSSAAAVYDKTHSNNNNSITVLSTPTSVQQSYAIWTTDYALRFFKRISEDLKSYIEGSGVAARKSSNHNVRRAVEPISLRGGFIKIESIKPNQRPYYQLFRKPTEWPKIELNRDDGAFRLSPKRNQAPEEPQLEKRSKMTRKPRSRPSQAQAAPKEVLKKADDDITATKTGDQAVGGAGGGVVCKKPKESSEKQCGVCEICKIEYDTLTIHLKTKDHEYFAKNSQNFIALDSLIHASANVNKFLDGNKSLEFKPEIEEVEMEVVEEVESAETNMPDPLGNNEPPKKTPQKRGSSGNPYKTPSPTLREKSKRSTKGKHSSEKFQNFSTAKLTRSGSISPQKKQSRASNMLELQKSSKKDTVNCTPVAAVPARKKPKASSVISPPIRAMLPPSSLYKVVENSSTVTQRHCDTPPRKSQEIGPATVASPSLIVKFKKVRQTELMRLNGEAENFMFPPRRISSDLPTDIDLQTTSENTLRTSISLSTSTSLDSTNEQQMDCEFKDVKNSKMVANKSKAGTGGRMKASDSVSPVAKRKKGRPCGSRSFPNAPIQPEEFTLKRFSSAALTTANITLPEATRKSSRTATAIVTAATKSSRLLRAAVEAAKNNKRLSNDCRQAKSSTAMSKSPLRASLAGANKTLGRRQTAAVVKLEDRMGDAVDQRLNTDATDNDEDEYKSGSYHKNDTDSDEEEEADDDNDEDFVIRSYGLNKKAMTTTAANRTKRNAQAYKRSVQAYTRSVQAYKRSVQAYKSKVRNTTNPGARKNLKQKVGRSSEGGKTKSNPKVKAEPKSSRSDRSELTFSVAKKTSSPKQLFDISKSEYLPKMQYSFERVPVVEPWYRVFSRQDAGEEQIYEYYGSTNYRKLPYELGPIPFNRTLDGISCKLCGLGEVVASSTQLAVDVKPEATRSECLATEIENPPNEAATQTIAKVEEPTKVSTSPTTTSPCKASTSSSSKYTHKKLHLLQRYRREQQELLQKQHEAEQEKLKNKLQTQKSEAASKAVEQQRIGESKASTPEPQRHIRRASSTQSNDSSCASSSGTTLSKKLPRNKHLNRAAFLSLELPNRKSPREHASTLALVSCLIRQRQDSQSKPNSETDEPPPTIPPVNFAAEEENISERQYVSSTTDMVVTTVPEPSTSAGLPAASALTTRSASSATPVEEIRFATEISENVKRLRRGQNKYDHSSGIMLSSLSPSARLSTQCDLEKTAPEISTSPGKQKRQIRQPSKFKAYSGVTIATQGKTPSIRKTGTKKGVLEFEVDEAALNALESSKQYTDPRQLECVIDNYLQLAGRTYDFDDLPFEPGGADNTEENTDDKLKSSTATATTSVCCTNTPPTTDYFSSDFDLYDLISGGKNDAINSEYNQASKHSSTTITLCPPMDLQSYFKKRKNLKSNRTGWPKIQKKKNSARQEKKLEDKINFLKEIGEYPDRDDVLKVKEELLDDDDEDSRKQQSGVITPPDTDDDEDEDTKTAINIREDETEDTELVDAAGESTRGEYDADTVMDNYVCNGDDERVQHKRSAEGDDPFCQKDTSDDAVRYKPVKKRIRHASVASPGEKTSTNTANTLGAIASTSTPCTQLLRSLRRTSPQLNGSLGSCVSPSEKAGDNSDIFTVSSDGLDTDLDLSNSQHVSQQKPSEELELRGVNHTPKRKFDLCRCTRSNSMAATSSSCAVEAASRGSKSLAISKFLTKEVKVTCRRLRTPFRRFRYQR